MALNGRIMKSAELEKIKKLARKYGGSETDVWAVGVGGFVRFDGTTVVIRQTGLLGRGTVGKGEKRIPARAITAIQLKPAGVIVSGFIQFSMGGATEQRSKFGRQTLDAATDENSMMFAQMDQHQFEALRDAIEAATAPQTVQLAYRAQPASAVDPLDQLRKLAELRDAGVLTEAEFSAKKAELMRRL
jgi:uncharacterized protein DUF4429/putative oligomerization/nucleic acid binding protein